MTQVLPVANTGFETILISWHYIIGQTFGQFPIFDQLDFDGFAQVTLCIDNNGNRNCQQHEE